MKPTECYAVLGLKAGAPLSEVRRAYKRLAWKHHPDCGHDNVQSHERFCEITAAYSRLRAISPERGCAGPAVSICETCGDVQKSYPGLDGVMRCAACLLAQRRRRLPMSPMTTARCLGSILLQIIAAGFLIRSAQTADNTGAIASMTLLIAAMAMLTLDVLHSTVTDR